MLNRLISLALAGALSLCLISGAPAAQGSGCLPTTGTVSGLIFAQGVNSAIAALISSNSGASAPSTDCSAAPVAGQVWLDTSVSPRLLKQYDGTSWVVLGAIDGANHLWSPPVGGGTATVTAASTTDICAAPSAVQTINGTTTITSFGSSCVVGARKTLIFASATPITYNATSLILPGQRSYTSAAGDAAEAIYLGAGNWRVLTINKIDGSSVVNPSLPLNTVLYGDYSEIPPKTVIGDGAALSRAAYPDFFAAASRVVTGTLTAGNNTITSIAGGRTRGLGAGMPLEGNGIQAGTTILSVTSSTIVMSQTASANGSQSVRAFITGYGTGGDSTTVGVKNCIGKVVAGLDPSGTNLSNAAAINSSQGSKEHTLTAAQIPAHTHPNTLTDPGHNHTLSQLTRAASQGQPGTGNLLAAANFNPVTSTEPTGVTITNAANTGGGVAHPIVQPTIIAECVVVVLP